MTTIDSPPTHYEERLRALRALADGLPDSRLTAVAKVATMAQLNMRWETAMFDRQLQEHPWLVAGRLIDEAAVMLRAWQETAFIADPARSVQRAPEPMEISHHDLFQDLWVNFSSDDYRERIERYDHRLRINALADDFLTDRRCVDFGCGHGNFAHALLNAGARSVLGIDYGAASIDYAAAARDRLGVAEGALNFEVASVYECPAEDSAFDFAIQNGVFHHLDDEDAAYREVHRVLETGGWFWIYTDGAGAVSHDFWDTSVAVLRDIPHAFVVETLDYFGVEVNKRYHLGDGLNAVYRHVDYDAFLERLARYGFGNPRRLIGGFPTDFDHDVIASDPWGVEKFGCGDIRVLVQKL